jgi:signal transduction histidine kinase
MRHHISTQSTQPAIDHPESEQSDRSLPGHRRALQPGTYRFASAERDSAAAEARTLREVCHDLTMPAASIRLLASVAVKESDPDPALRARLRQIAEEASRIADICGYFLDPSRSAGPADLGLLAAGAADSARSRYPGTIDVVADTVAAAAHPVDVARVLANLLDNACRAAGPDGRVRLVVARDADQARLVVADSGRGFGRGEPGRASLGLGIVTGLVRRNGGVLRKGSSNLGGLAVTVVLPAADRDRADGVQPAVAGGEPE